jgi:hypothetical protein
VNEAMLPAHVSLWLRPEQRTAASHSRTEAPEREPESAQSPSMPSRAARLPGHASNG